MNQEAAMGRSKETERHVPRLLDRNRLRVSD